MLDQRPAASPVQQHRAEEAAHDEEQRHPEAVDGGEDDPETGILLTIRDDPERREERQGRVQDDPQQHGDGPQGVQVGSSGKGRILDGQGRHGCEALQSFSRFEIMSEGDKSRLLFYCSISIVQVAGNGCQPSVPEDLPAVLVDLLDRVISRRSMAPIVGRPEGLRCRPLAARDESGWALLMKPCDSACTAKRHATQRRFLHHKRPWMQDAAAGSPGAQERIETVLSASSASLRSRRHFAGAWIPHNRQHPGIPLGMQGMTRRISLHNGIVGFPVHGEGLRGPWQSG